MDLSGTREKLVQQHGDAERETKALQAAFEAERQAFSEALRGKAEHAAKVKEEVPQPPFRRSLQKPDKCLRRLVSWPQSRIRYEVRVT